MKIPVSFCGAILLGTLLCSPAFADDCAMPHAAALMLEAQRGLGALPVGDGMQTDVPAKGSALISAFKSRMNDYVSASMRCHPGNLNPTVPEKALDGFAGVKLPGNQFVNPGKQNDDTHYGDALKFEVRAPQPGLITVVARFGIECGGDAMLMIFERRGNAWVETLRTTGAPYETVAGGWGTFGYGISPRDRDGHWFVVTKNIAPWCSSTWSEIRYAVLRPGADATHPRTLLSRADSIWWGADRYGDLKVDAEGFDLRWRAESMDDGVHNREWIAHYAVDGDRVHRIAPIAETPRDFADEWLRLDWREAKEWTEVKAYGLKSLHDRLQKRRFLDYVAIRHCKDSDHTEIEVEPTDSDDRHIFFDVAGKIVPLMRDVSLSADPRCKGPNLFDMNKAR